MPLTVGNTQKLVSIAVKHAWCHALLPDFPESAPFDRFVYRAANEQVGLAGLRSTVLMRPWSKMDLHDYAEAWDLLMRAAGSTGLSVAEWELRVFQPGRGAVPIPVGAPLVRLEDAKAAFLAGNSYAANPGSPLVDIERSARSDARHAAFLMGARPYDFSKAQIDASFPGQFEAFKEESEVEAWRITEEFISGRKDLTHEVVVTEVERLTKRLREKYPFL